MPRAIVLDTANGLVTVLFAMDMPGGWVTVRFVLKMAPSENGCDGHDLSLKKYRLQTCFARMATRLKTPKSARS